MAPRCTNGPSGPSDAPAPTCVVARREASIASRRWRGGLDDTLRRHRRDHVKFNFNLYAESDGHGRPEEFHEKALRREAAPYSNTVEVGFYYRNARPGGSRC